MTRDDADMGARLRQAFDLYGAGVQITRERLRRENPGVSKVELERLLAAEMRRRPGAEFGDADGVPATWPRR